MKEQEFELHVVEELTKIGWKKSEFKRNDYSETINFNLLKSKLMLINDINEKMSNKAIFEIRKINDNNVEIMNQKCWEMLTDGIKIYDESSNSSKTIKLISKNVDQNSYEFFNQFEVIHNNKRRVPDVVLFINGLPVVIMELKSPTALEGVDEAFQQNETLKREIPNLWKFNILNFISNRIVSKYGSITSSFQRFHTINNFKTRDNDDAIDFLFSFNSLYQFITTFSYYANENNKMVKYIAAPHQIIAVNKEIAKLKNAFDNKGGVIWHTQGSGKSITMLILAKAIFTEFKKATILVVTDRNDLDDQLYKRFLTAEKYLRNTAVSIESRSDLINKLNDKLHFGLYFSTVQKFNNETGILTKREDVFIIVDEAHRTQNNISGEIVVDIAKKEVVMKYGFAKYMRDAFPNSKLIAFTGTPLMKVDKKTIEIFGDYTHKYLMNDAVADGATVPIHYEMRMVNINLNPKFLNKMDMIQEDYIKSLNPDDVHSQQKVDALLKNISLKEVLEDKDVVTSKAKDMLKHLEKRSAVLHGKSMIVANSRKAAYLYYESIIHLKPEIKDRVILVMSGNNKDEKKLAESIVSKDRILTVAEEFRKDNSKYQIAIVVDMWLTGFDVQDLDTLYIDKIIKWHNLMQAIARVNRTYENHQTGLIKVNGLFVDYIGIWKNLVDALSQYTGKNKELFDFSVSDIEDAKNKLVDSLQIVNDYYIDNIYEYPTLTAQEKWTFTIKSFDNILGLSLREKNKFVTLARQIRRFYKMSFSSLDDSQIMTVKMIESINSMLTSDSLQTDDNFKNIVQYFKEAVRNSIDMKTSEVTVSESKISRNINDVADILEKEAKEIESRFPRVSIEMMKNSIKARIKELEKIRPIFAEQASKKLLKIISELQKNEDIQKVLDLLKSLAKECLEEQEKTLNFEDPEMQAFFEILANDDYLHTTQNSEVLKQIAEKLLKIIKDVDISQFETSPQVRSKIKIELIKLLKNDYNYPPDHLSSVSGILIDQISKRIKLNMQYFKGEK